jgi:uncharacterized protein YbaA (DUF1428 family)
MTYIDGIVAAVPQANRQAYLGHARERVGAVQRPGAARMVEN